MFVLADIQRINRRHIILSLLHKKGVSNYTDFFRIKFVFIFKNLSLVIIYDINDRKSQMAPSKRK